MTTYFLSSDANGAVTGLGSSPDGTVPDGFIECTAAQYALGQSLTVVNGVITEPSAASVLAKVKTAQWEKIKAMRDSRKSGGFKVGSNWYHSDAESRGQYGILLSTAIEKAMPIGTVLSPAWKDMAGNFAPMTVTLLRQIRDAGLVLEQQLFTVAETHKATMMGSTNPAGYDYTTGWPAVFAG